MQAALLTSPQNGRALLSARKAFKACGSGPLTYSTGVIDIDVPGLTESDIILTGQLTGAAFLLLRSDLDVPNQRIRVSTGVAGDIGKNIFWVVISK